MNMQGPIIDLNTASAWVATAKSGERYCYHVGNLAADAHVPDTIKAKEKFSSAELERRKSMTAGARMLLGASDKKLVHLVQKRVSPDVCEYWVIRR